MILSKVIKKQNIFSKFLVSYILILIIPLVINSITFYKTKSIVESEINRANSSILKQIKDVLDGKIIEAQGLTFQIATNSKMVASARDDVSLIEVSALDEYSISNQLKELKNANDFFSDIFIYYKNSQKVISYRSNLNSQWFYESYYKNSKLPFVQWLNLIDNQKVNNVKATYTMEGNGTVEVLQPIPIGITEVPDATAVVVIDYVKLKNLIANVEYLNGGGVAIFDKSNKLITSSEPKYDFIDASKYNKEGYFDDVIDGKKFRINLFESKLTGCKYISIVPNEIFWEKFIYFRNLNLIGIAVFLFLGGFSAYFFTKGNYNPFKDIINWISENSKIDFNRKENNELEFLANVFNSMIEEKEKLKEKQKNGQEILRERFLVKLLKGERIKEVSIEDSFLQHNITLNTQYFSVLLFSIEKCTENISVWYGEDDFELVGFVIKNVVEELAANKHQGFLIGLDKKSYACIINLSNNNETIENDLINICSQAKKFLEEKFSIFCSISISDVHNGIFGINEAYIEALDTMEYRVVLGRNCISTYSSIKNRVSNYKYDNKIGQTFMNYIKNGSSKEEAESLINEVFKQNMLDENASLEKAKCFIYDIVGILTKITNEICAPSFVQERRIINRLITSETLSELKRELIQVITEINDYVKLEKNRNLIGIEVMNLINDNFFDLNINISTLGDKFGISPSYLSKVFREQVGTSVLEYLCKIRLLKSKQLLKETDLEISDISQRVGFSSSSVYIRRFKEHEGITPGAYRDL